MSATAMVRLGTPAAAELLVTGSLWRLLAPLDGYSRPSGAGLATQAAAGRCLEVLQAATPPEGRLRVRLLEDGYSCWLDAGELAGRAEAAARPLPRLLTAAAIQARLPEVLAFAAGAAAHPNHYLWGGTTGPHYDCSGFIQSAFAQAGIWIPRDAYQQERFCQPVAVSPSTLTLLRPGDLIFFGRPQRCTHVGLHLGSGRYLHSSGRDHGRNGLGIDQLAPWDTHPVASHYRRELRGAGRVVHCHDGSPLP
jgi:hypothetical protein